VSFYASAGRILVTDGADTVLDTDERLFTVTNGPISGMVTVPTRTATRVVTSGGTTNNYIELDTNATIASVNSAANTVRGSFYAEVSGSASGVSNRGWFNASGSYCHFLYPINPALGGSGNVALPSLAAYTFIASGGSLYLNERTRLEAPRSISNGTYTLSLPAVNLYYYLFVGTFV
jgi:hypothetical protein